MKNTSKKIYNLDLVNTRDLGGIVTSDGRKIKSGRLIRSGHLSGLSDDTAKKLRLNYGLKTVIDLRMDAETDEAPDTVIPGVDYVFCPLLSTEAFGIARDEYSMKSWLNLFKDESVEPDEVFKKMYLDIAFSERNIAHFRRIFDILLSNKEGSVLWHCSAGKDRVGITTALVLGALGVDRRSITDDYALTEKCMRKELLRVTLFAPLQGYRGRMYRAIIILFSAKPEYIGRVLDEIESRYGSVPQFLMRHIGITEDEMEQLKDMYLE